MKRIFNVFIIIFLSVIFFSGDAFCRNPIFNVPPKMKGRVAFWVDIYTKYGKHVYVLHHRAYPQVVFKVLDFNSYARTLSYVQLQRYKEKVRANEANKIYGMLRRFAAGRTPQDAYERNIYNQLINLPGGKKNFSQVINDKLVRAQAGLKEETGEAIKRSGRYIGIMERIFVNEYGLPFELTRIPFVESSFNYKATSAVGAAGIWQFMRRTAAGYGMMVNDAVDERKDPVVATRAAAKYLKHSFKVLESWPLAITAYNHGPTGVARKVKAYGTRDISYIIEHPTKRMLGFASNNFYAEFLAALEVYEKRKIYFPGIEPYRQLEFLQYPLKFPIKVNEVLRRVGISLNDFQTYNYALTNKTMAGYYAIPKGYKIKLPTFMANKVPLLDSPDKSLKYTPQVSTWSFGNLYYTVKKGDTLGKIARNHKVSVQQIKNLNGLRSDNIAIGRTLLISKRGGGQQSSNNFVPQRNYGASNVYVVRKGDTLDSVARRFKTTIANIKSKNNLRNNVIKIGQKLSVPGAAQHASVPASNTQSYGNVYVVKKGDTLSSVALKHRVSINALKAANGLRNNTININQRLRIPSGTQTSINRGNVVRKQAPQRVQRTYVVRKGDSLWSISKKFGVSIDSIRKQNRIGAKGIQAGQTLHF